ncbi:cytolethal distending toxin subunit B family protein, partial [Glaesserella parasuis]
WNLGTRSRPNNVYIYYSRLDVGANRVNLAIIARRMASEVYVINSGSSVLTSRPAIGIRIDNDAFFSIHAL